MYVSLPLVCIKPVTATSLVWSKHVTRRLSNWGTKTITNPSKKILNVCYYKTNLNQKIAMLFDNDFLSSTLYYVTLRDDFQCNILFKSLWVIINYEEIYRIKVMKLSKSVWNLIKEINWSLLNWDHTWARDR